MICKANGIELCPTKPNHPWTNGQVERMNQPIKDARRLKTLSGLALCECICRLWTSEPDRFIVDPIHRMQALNT